MKRSGFRRMSSITGATWTGQKHTAYRSRACHSHRYCRREETCRGRERDKGSVHPRERQSGRRKGWISRETMIQIEKNIWSEAAAARRETDPAHRRSSGERTRTQDKMKREKNRHTPEGLKDAVLFRTIHSIPLSRRNLDYKILDDGSRAWRASSRSHLSILASSVQKTLWHRKYNHRD